MKPSTTVSPVADDDPELAGLPRVADRQRAAEFISDRFFRVSARTLEKWPVAGRLINGRRVSDTRDWIAAARAKMNAAA